MRMTRSVLPTLALTIAVFGGCQSSTASSGRPADAAGGSNSGSFCALAKEKGLQNMLAMDEDAGNGDTQTLLDNLDAITAAAPDSIKPDFEKLDKWEHGLLGGPGGQVDPKQVTKSGDMAPTLRHIADYLHVHCGIG